MVCIWVDKFLRVEWLGVRVILLVFVSVIENTKRLSRRALGWGEREIPDDTQLPRLVIDYDI
jgi:hypothetical protein